MFTTLEVEGNSSFLHSFDIYDQYFIWFDKRNQYLFQAYHHKIFELFFEWKLMQNLAIAIQMKNLFAAFANFVLHKLIFRRCLLTLLIWWLIYPNFYFWWSQEFLNEDYKGRIKCSCKLINFNISFECKRELTNKYFQHW